ncbi:Uncharacterised protein [uncultured archaeon]|nr:Uncharacterised protein [uncultured archaeon]
MDTLISKFQSLSVKDKDECASIIQTSWRQFKSRKSVLKIISPIGKVKIKMLKSLIKSYLGGRKEFYKVMRLGLEIEPKYAEFCLKMSTNGEYIGNGNSPLDIIVNNRGIDCAVLKLHGNFTNEKSIIQNFKTSGSNLDKLFKIRNDKRLLNYIKYH